jgi:hypothetical protein
MQLYMDYVYRWFGLPTKIISDRDPCFTSHFGKELAKTLAIGQNLSTTFHPQTDGLSEHKNQWIKQYLCAVTGGQPEDWNKWFSIATAVHNNRINSTIRMSPNQVLMSRPGCWDQVIGLLFTCRTAGLLRVIYDLISSFLPIVVTRYFFTLLAPSLSFLSSLSPSGTFHSRLLNILLPSGLFCMLPICFC